MALNGRTALVTGASKGIGLATTRLLAQEGCKVIMVARNLDMLNASAREIATETGAMIEVASHDTGNPDTPSALACAFPDVDILVNNSGGVPPGSLAELSLSDIEAGWQPKVFGYLGMIQAFYPLMKQRCSGAIVNVIGMSGERVNAKAIALSGANAALVAMTRALGAESPAHGVRIVGVNPGVTATERARLLWKKQAADEFGDESRWAELVEGLPFGRAAEPGDIANVIAFLASSRAGYISGSVINVDGGSGARP
ncbi:short-chain dehydrogenase/reductase [Hoeflea sp. G2-23]|uniref:Short-chain dehydrogenase/reductase n=1 Tax=Hoeflea algicola TaxID=2983763 RepID=A0ABT3Z9P6_9HYPH|nr:short-chain dehydrogenase/reductase [Hoeflea algicola]MCY0148509.1 short-chain dehydrogenase/reductase [Hoeflea algicola]